MSNDGLTTTCKDSRVIESFAEYLKNLRSATGMDQYAFARHLGYSRTYISSVERGHRTPSLGLLGALREHYGLSLDAFFDTLQQNLKIQTTALDLPQVSDRTITDAGQPLT